MKKIVLIEPQSKADHVYKSVRMPRLGLPILGVQLKAAGYAVNLYVGTSGSLPWSRILDADLVGISTRPRPAGSYRMAGYLRARHIPVVWAASMPPICLTKRCLCRLCCAGEADCTFYRWCRPWKRVNRPIIFPVFHTVMRGRPSIIPVTPPGGTGPVPPPILLS